MEKSLHEYSTKTRTSRDRRVGAGLMIASAITWALGTVASKYALTLSEAPTPTMLVVQLLASVGVLGGACLLSGMPSQLAWRSGWVGLLEPGATYQLVLAGLSLTSAASASVLGSLEPALVPLVAWLLFRERPRLSLIVVIAGATLGSMMVAFSGSGEGRSILGDGLIVLSVVTAALYVVLAGRFIADVRPLPAALTQQVWALVVVVVIAFASGGITGGSVWPAGRADWIAVARSRGFSITPCLSGCI